MREVQLRNSYFKISDKVKQAMVEDFTDHRSNAFMKYKDNLEAKFCEEFSTKYCTFVQGSGTLTNEIMLEEIYKRHKFDGGLVLNHGEFGNRLVHAVGLKKLPFVQCSEPYETLYGKIKDLLTKFDINWILFPLCESSTGVVYDLNKIREILPPNISIYIDGMSYIGNAPIDLSGVKVFTGSSGKGLGSFPGIGILLYNDFYNEVSGTRYLDLSYYQLKDGVPFTISTSQIRALGTSCRERLSPFNYIRIDNLQKYIRERVQSISFLELEYLEQRHLAFFSFKVSSDFSSVKIGEYLESKGIYISFRTRYLVDKNCIEIALLDYNLTIEELEYFFTEIEEYRKRK